jgi:hypothetical protein
MLTAHESGLLDSLRNNTGIISSHYLEPQQQRVLKQLQDKHLVKVEQGTGTISLCPVDIVDEVQQLTQNIRLKAFSDASEVLQVELCRLRDLQRADFDHKRGFAINVLKRLIKRMGKMQ